MKIGLVQMTVTHQKENNLVVAKQQIKKLSRLGADIVILPEMFTCPYDVKVFGEYSEVDGGETYKVLSTMAKEENIIIVGGSIPEKSDSNIYNTSYVFDEAGNLIAKHQKHHLFDIDIPNGITFKESETLTSGEKLTVFDTRFGRMGLMICFDIRFIEDAAALKAKGIDFLVVPGAFNQVTGPLHWELLFRSRANDLQCFTIGVAPARSGEGYQSYGHSIVCNSLGEVIYQAGSEPVSAIIEIDVMSLRETRKNIPILNKV